MPSRTSPPPLPQMSPSFGLVSWLEQTRVQLPLKGVECRFHACGDLLSVEIDQIFHQQHAQPLDCLYTFPLPAGAAVHRCEMHVNDRVIRARVEERSRAREIAQEQKAAGRRTALVEMDRENLFTLSLGNLQPGDVVVIRFAYVQTLTRLVDWTSLRIPFCPGVRYIPGQPLLRSLTGKGVSDDTDQAPDASRISPPRIDALHPDAAYLSVRGIIENPLGKMSEICSPSHAIVVRDGDGEWTITLAQQGAAPDCDFALRWTETCDDQIRSAAWALRDGGDTYALLFLQAPRVPALPSQGPQDFYFLVDRSGSMAGLKWKKALQSFCAFLNHLGPHDRAWATFFNEHWQDFAERPLSAGDLLADDGLASLERLGAGGGTELLPALNHILNVMEAHSADRQTTLLLITDGQVGNEPEILARLRAFPNLRIHTFGIDQSVNDAFLKCIADQHHGSSCLLQPTDDIVGAVTRLATRLRNPILTSISPADGWLLPTDSAPDLHSGQSVSLSLKRNSSIATAVELRGKLASSKPETGSGGSSLPLCDVGSVSPVAANSSPSASPTVVERRTEQESPDEIRRTVPLIERAEPALRLLWAHQRIGFLIRQGQHAEALTLAKHHNLLCDGAAFIAWDEAEEVAVAQRELYQPSLAGPPFTFAPATPFAGSSSNTETWCQLFIPASSESGKIPRSSRSKFYRATFVAVDRHIRTLLTSRPHLDPQVFFIDLGYRLRQWAVRCFESRGLPYELGCRDLIFTLVEWVIDGGPDLERRLKSLEELIERLEPFASEPEAGLALTFDWHIQSLPESDLCRDRVAKLLQELNRKLAEIRERERTEQKAILHTASV